MEQPLCERPKAQSEPVPWERLMEREVWIRAGCVASVGTGPG